MSIKIIYRYDKTTKEYLGEVTANESPVRPGTYFLQPYTAETAPPVADKSEVAVFDTATGEWKIKPDYRGGVYYDTGTQERHEITAIGVIPAANYTDISPTSDTQVWNGTEWELPLAELKVAKIAEILSISTTKAAAIEEGYSLGEVKTFEQQYQGAVDIFAGNPDTTAAQFVIALAAKRSAIGGVEISAATLAKKIVDNYTAAKEYTLKILSIQQGLEEMIRKGRSKEEIEAIKWPDMA